MIKYACSFLLLVPALAAVPGEASAQEIVARVTVDRGRDFGQAFGSLFEATSDDGAVTIGAGFANAYNTRYRNDRHALAFFVRPNRTKREFESDVLPRPNHLCGTYLYSRDGTIYSTYGGVKTWQPKAGQWLDVAFTDQSPNQSSDKPLGGTAETMRVGSHLLEFGDSMVRCDGRTVLEAPELGSYQLFFYCHGHLCFYHVHRRDKPYRPYQNDEDGFSKLYACPWAPDGGVVDLSKAVIKTLPVVGETTFAWGQFNSQVVTGSNIGGFYVLKNGQWSMLLEPQLGVSYQLYSTLGLHDQLLMGQYPTGRIFRYDGKSIRDQPGWPPIMEGVTSSAREAQTTAIYGGEFYVGVWPWGEVWRYNPATKTWSFVQRMFDHPERSSKITHPYDVENQKNAVKNLWGQRVTSLIPNHESLYVATSAKYPCVWEPEKYSFLKENWKSYGGVHRLTTPGHLGVTAAWTEGSTMFELAIKGDEMRVSQDGRLLGTAKLPTAWAGHVHSADFTAVQWGEGIYGPFAGQQPAGKLTRQQSNESQ